MDESQFKEAYDCLRTALSQTYRHYSWLERDTSWTYELFDMLSLAAYYSGKKKESLSYAVKAYYACKSDDRLKDNIDRIIENMSDKDFL